jgi:hypothetical protein
VVSDDIGIYVGGIPVQFDQGFTDAVGRRGVPFAQDAHGVVSESWTGAGVPTVHINRVGVVAISNHLDITAVHAPAVSQQDPADLSLIEKCLQRGGTLFHTHAPYL